jgi:hypothetical protein
MKADHGSHEESWAHHGLQGLRGHPTNRRISPIIILVITHNNMAAIDKDIEREDVAKKVIGSTEVQDKARVARNQYRKLQKTSGH